MNNPRLAEFIVAILSRIGYTTELAQTKRCSDGVLIWHLRLTDSQLYKNGGNLLLAAGEYEKFEDALAELREGIALGDGARRVAVKQSKENTAKAEKGLAEGKKLVSMLQPSESSD